MNIEVPEDICQTELWPTTASPKNNYVKIEPETQTVQDGKIRLPKNYQYFMCHIDHEHYDLLENTLKEYEIGEYVIGAETTPDTGIQHFHFLVEMSSTEYHKYAKRIFKDKFKLRGRATKGAPRQYGKINDIKSLENAAAYTIKDGNIRTNMTQERISHLKELSYEKKGDDILSKLKVYCDENYLQIWPEHYDEPKKFALMIIDYLRANNRQLRASTIRHYTIQCLAYSDIRKNKTSNLDLYTIMFPMGI